MQRVSLTINGQTVLAPADATILSVARRQGIEIPTLCHLPGLKTRAVCRICVVALAGSDRLVPACATPVEDGMEIETDCAAVIAARRLLMEFILAEHGECDEPECEIEQLADLLGVTKTRFQSPEHASNGNLSSDFITVRPELCIHCDRCVQACGKDQRVLARAGRGGAVVVAFDDDQSMANSSCTHCGDCVAVCPAGGLLETV
jgi:NADH dehydrogenase/NADH:ubiquinone oxidoreductase subunit G